MSRARRWGLTQLTCHVRSRPSGVPSLASNIAPALLTRTWTSARGPSKPSAKARTEANSARSSRRHSTSRLPVSSMMSRAATAARFLSRHARTTRAPARANSRAISLPMPVFAPVTTQSLPIMLPTGTEAIARSTRPRRAGCVRSPRSSSIRRKSSARVGTSDEASSSEDERGGTSAVCAGTGADQVARRPTRGIEPRVPTRSLLTRIARRRAHVLRGGVRRG